MYHYRVIIPSKIKDRFLLYGFTELYEEQPPGYVLLVLNTPKQLTRTKFELCYVRPFIPSGYTYRIPEQYFRKYSPPKVHVLIPKYGSLDTPEKKAAAIEEFRRKHPSFNLNTY